MKKNIYCVVLGGYVNSYNIIKELYNNKVKNIAVIDNTNNIARFSNKIKYFKKSKYTNIDLEKAIVKLKKNTNSDYLIIYPTSDEHIEILHNIFENIKSFCYIPFNNLNIKKNSDKFVQYNFCKKHNIPYPKSVKLTTTKELAHLKKLKFPIIIKPTFSKDRKKKVFRALQINNSEELTLNKCKIKNKLNNNIHFIASEYIPGDDTNIYSYIGFRSKNKKILNEWHGKKLNQYPNNFGNFSSASNECPDIVLEQGRTLLTVMDLEGIAQPEFKYDARDKKYKLTEINLRSMMWHGLGHNIGIDLHYTQYLDAQNIKVNPKKETHKNNTKIHFVYFAHEFSNLIFRKNYWKNFKYNLFSSNKVKFAIFDKTDLFPFLYSLKFLILILLKGIKDKLIK